MDTHLSNSNVEETEKGGNSFNLTRIVQVRMQILTILYWNGHNLFVQPASSSLFMRISGVH